METVFRFLLVAALSGAVGWLLARRRHSESNVTKPILEDGDLIIGYPDEWRTFVRGHSMFYEVLPKVMEAINLAFNRTFHSKNKADSLVFLLGCLVVEDFDEIMLLSGNGRGFGSQKILRGMFERAVTLAYLHEHREDVPDEASRFLKFYPIARYKLSQSLHQTLGKDVIDAATLAQHKVLRDGVLEDYQAPCGFDGCEKVRDGFSWTSMSVVEMAQSLPNFKPLIGLAYYMPMPDTHANIMAIFNRLDGQDTLTMHQSDAKARVAAKQTLSMAHWLAILALDVQAKHFPDLAPVLAPLVEALAPDYKAAWGAPAA